MSLNPQNSNKVIPLIDYGNVEVFTLLYDLYKPKMFHIAINYVVSKEDAEEIVQDVFVKLWKGKEELGIRSNFTGYLYQMVRNACLDFLRAKKRILAVETNVLQQEHLLNYHALANEAASAILEKELEAAVADSIEQLPEKCKRVFIKSRIEGLKHQEISQELNISSKTVENHITKALRHLRVALKEHLPFF